MFTVDAPELAPSERYGLLKVANVTENADRYLLHEPFKYESRLQGHNKRVPAPGTDKTTEGKPGVTESVNWSDYRLLDISLLNGEGEGEALLKPAFAAGEEYSIESAVQTLLLNPVAVDITPTPGTAVTNVKDALGLLEQWIAERYNARPTLSGNLHVTTLIPDMMHTPDGTLTSVHSTPIAGAAGYGADGPGVTDAPAGTAWLYVSGQINIWKSDPQFAAGAQLAANRHLTLAEARYAATVDGPVAAILVGTN